VEIAETRELVASITRFAMKMGYENVEAFTTFVGDKAARKTRMAQAEQQGGGIGIGMPIGN